MQISQELLWLGPYLEQISDIVDISRLSEIKVLSCPKNTKQFVVGYMRRSKDEVLYIELAIIRQLWSSGKSPKIVGLTTYSKIDILINLAHELAHLKLILKKDEWNHTPEHKIIEALLTTEFMFKLAKENYISEEHEDKENRRIRRNARRREKRQLNR